MNAQIHRADLFGKPRCGQIGRVTYLSYGLTVNCPKCIELETPNKEEQMKSLLAATTRFQAKGI